MLTGLFNDFPAVLALYRYRLAGDDNVALDVDFKCDDLGGSYLYSQNNISTTP